MAIEVEAPGRRPWRRNDLCAAIVETSHGTTYGADGTERIELVTRVVLAVVNSVGYRGRRIETAVTLTGPLGTVGGDSIWTIPAWAQDDPRCRERLEAGAVELERLSTVTRSWAGKTPPDARESMRRDATHAAALYVQGLIS